MATLNDGDGFAMRTRNQLAGETPYRKIMAPMIRIEAPDVCHAEDAALKQRILRFLASIGVQELENIDVEVAHGVATLCGRVISPRDRWLCSNGAGRVAGVLRVIDQLEIGSSFDRNGPALFEKVRKHAARRFEGRRPK
jgi:hypothetical protein